LFAALRAEIFVSSLPAAEFIKLITAENLTFSLTTGTGKVLIAYGTDNSFHRLPAKNFLPVYVEFAKNNIISDC